MNEIICPDCNGSGLSRIDCICHGGGGATKECSPCPTCKTEGYLKIGMKPVNFDDDAIQDVHDMSVPIITMEDAINNERNMAYHAQKALMEELFNKDCTNESHYGRHAPKINCSGCMQKYKQHFGLDK